MKLKKNIATFGLAGLLALPSCISSGYDNRTPEQRQEDEQRGREVVGGVLGIFGSGLMGKAIQKGNPGGFMYGRGMRDLGRNLAQSGQQPKIEQNFYGNAPQQEQQQTFGQEPQTPVQRLDEYFDGERTVGRWISPPASFTCSSFRDKNGDGFIGKDELKDLGSYFSCKEKKITTTIICGATFDNVRGMKITGIIKDGKSGEIIKVQEEQPEFIMANNQAQWIYVPFFKAEDDKGIHPYEVNWMVDGRILPTRTINFFVDYGE